MYAASTTAAELADRLATHPRVTAVHYAARRPCRPRGQLDGGDALVSFEVSGDPRSVVGAVRLITPAVSLGSVDTLIQHLASLTHRNVEPIAREAAGISDALLRISIGLEDVEDLWHDLDQALTT